MTKAWTDTKVTCYHCGEPCTGGEMVEAEKHFCCQGCYLVYQIVSKNGLCNYYSLNEKPGANQRIQVRKDKFAFLDDKDIRQKLISFDNSEQTIVTFYLPQIHCSSCLYLLENLHKVNNGITSARINFARKEAEIIFDPRRLSLRETAELLTSIGYEPYISLGVIKHHQPRTQRKIIYQLGVAGFCFANIMLLSFPEYLGLADAEKKLQGFFRTLGFILALPVFFYSAQPFFISGWNGLKNRFLNIDAPIALAVVVTFGRSVCEVMSGTGPGYFDSMSGIVFFMLTGRILQDKTYQQLSFERDFTSYFPIAASVWKNAIEIPTPLQHINVGDTLLIHNGELVPADGILTKGKAFIDYSFVTGESLPAAKDIGEIVYAGGRQAGGAIEILVIKEVMHSYLTKLWERDELKKAPQEKSKSFVHLLSRWFTYIVLLIAVIAAVYWSLHDSTKIWSAVTAVLIVACPCALLLSNTFTNGNILRILSRHQFFLRGAQTIEDIAGINHIVFDKTGTLTATGKKDIVYTGHHLSAARKKAVAALASYSSHPLSKALAGYYSGSMPLPEVQLFTEIEGKGLKGFVNDQLYAIGSAEFITGRRENAYQSRVHLSVNGEYIGVFTVSNHFRESVPVLLKELPAKYQVSVISGDNTSERERLQQLLGPSGMIRFYQSPENKLDYIKCLQANGNEVMMIGDGLNDAGALKQSNAGIAIAEDCNNFTPASDAIMQAGQLQNLYRFIRLCKANRQIVTASFILSIGYNIIGIWFAVQASLSPLIAAILMPCSSISILLVTYGSSSLAAKWLKL